MTQFRRQTIGVLGFWSVALAASTVACGPSFSAGAGDEPAGDTPTVLSVSPANAQQDIEPDAKVTVTLSGPLAAASIDSWSVKLLERGREVAGTIAYVDSKVIFTPAQPLALLGEYRVSISTDVTDAEGSALAQAFESTFLVRDGKFHATTPVTGNVHELASTVPVESTGSVLLSWIDRAEGDDCPVLYQRFLRGVAVDSPRPLSTDGASSCGMLSARATPNGLSAVSWAERGGQRPFAAHVRQYREGTWSADQMLSADYESGLLSLGLASNGMISLVENLSGTSNAYRTDLTGEWAKLPNKLGDTGSAAAPSALEFDDAGNGLALWQASHGNVEQLYFSRYTTASGDWTAAALLPGSRANSGGAGYERGVPALATDAQGNAVALWTAAEGRASTPKLMASHYHPGSGWAAPLPIAMTFSGAPIHEPPALVFDGETFVAAFLAYHGNKLQTLVTRFDAANSVWSPPEPRQALGDPNSVTRMPKLASDGRGHVLLVWASDVGSTYELHYQRYANDAWGPTTRVPGGVIEHPDFPLTSHFSWSVASNTDGLAALAWTADDGSGLSTKRVHLASFY